ncbi:hypothetical protein V2K35_20160 [Pseudomonas alliivorans]|nr:hypothetical protein [Pseudomonas alliivorans]MEE4875518.1 hypothetical protein [Pseudomonas alliivorans]
MRNRKDLHTRRPKKELSLALPFVSVADETDGLIKTIDLESDVVVEFPVWEGAQSLDKYQLELNGKLVGSQAKLDPLPPEGTLLQLNISVADELRSDGDYALTYRITGYPSGSIQSSPPRNIVVDRTPPGTHQLGYMDFPDSAKDGLTLEELSAMGDVLTGSIFGYSGLKQGDTIKTYWGDVPGPELALKGTEDENEAIEIAFTKDFLTRLESPAGATYYTVTDRAGNVSAESKKITIHLLLIEVTPDLPPPVIDGYDGLIDHADALASVEVKIPGSAIIEGGDEIALYWGSEKLGPVPVEAEDISEPFILIFDVQYSTIELAQNGLRDLRYDVIRNGQIIGTSERLEINVNIELPVPGALDKLTVKGSSGSPSNEDNLIDENDFELDATLLINWNSLFKASQIVTVFWGGQEVLEQPYILTNSDVAAGRPLLLNALNSKFKPVGTGNDIRVYYTITQTGNPNMTTSPEQGIIVRSKDELPGGPSGPDAPHFNSLNENGAINRENGEYGASIFIKPYTNIQEGQIIDFTYEAYDDLVGGIKKFEWTHTSPALTQNEVNNGYTVVVPRPTLDQHCYGHTEVSFKVRSDRGQGNSKRATAYVDMRLGGLCGI